MKDSSPFQIAETQLNFKLSEDLKKKIQRYAKKNKMTVSMAIRLIVDKGISEEEEEKHQIKNN